MIKESTYQEDLTILNVYACTSTAKMSALPKVGSLYVQYHPNQNSCRFFLGWNRSAEPTIYIKMPTAKNSHLCQLIKCLMCVPHDKSYWELQSKLSGGNETCHILYLPFCALPVKFHQAQTRHRYYIISQHPLQEWNLSLRGETHRHRKHSE